MHARKFIISAIVHFNTSRDFDISPYFSVVKPTIEVGFDYKKINGSADLVPFSK